jgi:hypothetical protein
MSRGQEAIIFALAVVSLAVASSIIFATPMIGTAIVVGAIFERWVIMQKRKREEFERRWRLREAAWRAEGHRGA